jgi:hypothetical protein
MIAKPSMFVRGLSWRREMKRLKKENWGLSCLCNKHHAQITKLTRERDALDKVVQALGDTSATYDPCRDFHRLCINIERKTLSQARDPNVIIDHFINQLKHDFHTLLTNKH